MHTAPHGHSPCCINAVQVTACVGDTVTFDFLGEHNIWSLDNRAFRPPDFAAQPAQKSVLGLLAVQNPYPHACCSAYEVFCSRLMAGNYWVHMRILQSRLRVDILETPSPDLFPTSSSPA